MIASMSAKKALVAALVAVAVLLAFQEIGQGGEQAGAPAGIVFERNGDLYAIAVDGSRTARLTNTPTDESTPAVSLDGRSIAFAARFTTDPAISPDGRRIATAQISL